MIKCVGKAYEINNISDDANQMKEILTNRLETMMETKSKYAKVLLSTFFSFGKAFEYMDEDGISTYSAENVKAILAEIDKNIPKEVTDSIEDQSYVTLD